MKWSFQGLHISDELSAGGQKIFGFTVGIGSGDVAIQLLSTHLDVSVEELIIK